MMKQLFKYLLIFIVLASNIDNFSIEKKTSTKIMTAFFIIIVIIFIIKLFNSSKEQVKTQHSYKPINSPQPKFNHTNNNELLVLKKDLTEIEFKNCINSQLNKSLNESKDIFWVGDEHRNHPWSLAPGGSTVVVLFKDQKCIGYDKVKRPDRYTIKITTDYISNNISNKHFSSLEQYIKSIYLAEDGKIELKKVWDTNTNLSPWEILEKYRIK